MAGPLKNSRISPATNPPSLKKSNSGSQSNMGQKSISSFFQKRAAEGSAAKVNVPSKLPSVFQSADGTNEQSLPFNLAKDSSQSLTPAPSSDAIEEEDTEDVFPVKVDQTSGAKMLPSPITPANGTLAEETLSAVKSSSANFNSPSRKVGRNHYLTYVVRAG